MPHRVVWKLTAPMVIMSAFLLYIGGYAAWNVHSQQQANSELIAREVHGMVAIEELHLQMREIRYQINLFLRTLDTQHLAAASALHHPTELSLGRAKSYARTPHEEELINVVDSGYREFFRGYRELTIAVLGAEGAASLSETPRVLPELSPEHAKQFTRLSDDVLTNQVLKPLVECLTENQKVVETTNERHQKAAQHLKIGFVLLGICGAAAGVLTGTAIARTITRSIVQMNVSVRGVAGRLSNVGRPVTFSHTSDMAGIESGLKTIERDIADVVERLQQRETEVLRSEQLARVGQLAAGLAHELRNPLMPMKMLVQAAIERGDDAGLKGRSLQIIADEIARLEQAIQAFLDYARPPVPEKTHTDLREIVTATVDLVKARARDQRVKIVTLFPDRPVEAFVDRTQIRQLLLNLTLNAIDEMSSGGELEFAIESGVAPPNRKYPPPTTVERNDSMTEHDALRILSLSAERETEWAAIRVSDTGSGISADLLERLFEPFYTTKETGTGLGLSICRRIAAAHEGDLIVRNRESGGAEFTLYLPREAPNRLRDPFKPPLTSGTT